ncbi:hypothetical protein FOL47_008255 [Perkinsus chesapeaki]|uniref:Uncharacterized protein n=1 Tax=Perkinsus chesapeaki TaxID=330153 RepID=A0A7J6LF66_PERCH|nr:hypothetical protein FOL47_008255 [Perkinsus chesapeaki]
MIPPIDSDTESMLQSAVLPPANCCVFIEWDDVLFPTSAIQSNEVPPGQSLSKDYTATLSSLLTELLLKCRNDGLFILSEHEPGLFANSIRNYLPVDIANVLRRRFQFIHTSKSTCGSSLKEAVVSLGDPSIHVVLMSWRTSVLNNAKVLSKYVPEGFVKCVRFSRGLHRGMLAPQLRTVFDNLERIMTVRRHTTFVLCDYKSSMYQRSISSDSTASTSDGTAAGTSGVP